MTNMNLLMDIHIEIVYYKQVLVQNYKIMLDMIDHRFDKELSIIRTRKKTKHFFLYIKSNLHRGPIIKRSKSIRIIVVRIIVRFNVNNNCHKRHTHKPCSCA